MVQATLISKLKNQDAGSQKSDRLMKAVNVCDKFLTGAQGTQAELDVLKSQVRLMLAQQVCCNHDCTDACTLASLLDIIAGMLASKVQRRSANAVM